MKIVLSFLILFALMAGMGAPSAAAEEEWRDFPYALGGGAEMNMNTKEQWAQGFVITVDRYVNQYLALGIRGATTNDYKGITDFDASLWARLYFFRFGHGGAFTQMGGGFSSYQEEDRRNSAFFIDYGAGFRWFFLKGFYVEPYVQAGYPFQWAVGVIAGHWFNF
jgi:hypothetical protein